MTPTTITESLIVCEKCNKSKPLKSFNPRPSGYHNKQCNSCRRFGERETLRIKMQQRRQDYHAYMNETARKSHLKARRERPESFFVYRAKQIAIKKHLPFNLTVADIIIPEICPVLGIPLQFATAGQATDNSPSIDRVIPELGYVRGNVEIISKRANTIKSFGTIEEHQKVIEYIRKHQSKPSPPLISPNANTI